MFSSPSGLTPHPASCISILRSMITPSTFPPRLDGTKSSFSTWTTNEFVNMSRKVIYHHLLSPAKKINKECSGEWWPVDSKIWGEKKIYIWRQEWFISGESPQTCERSMIFHTSAGLLAVINRQQHKHALEGWLIFRHCCSQTRITLRIFVALYPVNR